VVSQGGPHRSQVRCAHLLVVRPRLCLHKLPFIVRVSHAVRLYLPCMDLCHLPAHELFRLMTSGSGSGTGLYTELLLDLREVAETVWTEQNPVVKFAGAKHEADRGSLGCGVLVEDNHVGSE
jgi:hypothetical protein